MKFTFNYKTIHLSVPSYTKLLDYELRDMVAHGAMVWINAATARIPVWSGASHGTFLKLAHEIGFSLMIAGGASINGLGGVGYGYSESAGKIFGGNGAYYFEYSTSLWHLIYNEYNDANANPTAGRLFARLRHPGPYDFQGAAADAFISLAKTVSLPSPWDTITLKYNRVS